MCFPGIELRNSTVKGYLQFHATWLLVKYASLILWDQQKRVHCFLQSLWLLSFKPSDDWVWLTKNNLSLMNWKTTVWGPQIHLQSSFTFATKYNHILLHSLFYAYSMKRDILRNTDQDIDFGVIEFYLPKSKTLYRL